MGKNSRNTTPREQMLKKIRHALLQKRDHPFPQFEDSQLYRENISEEQLAVIFAERLTAANGHFVYCESDWQLAENIFLLLDQRKLRPVYAWERSVQEFLRHFEFPFQSEESGYEAVSVGITTCEALIARHGSVLVTSANAAGRRLSSYPPIHIVIARTSQLVPDLHDGLSLLHQKYGARLPSSCSVITGPSRTADIEKTLVLGVHGPQELYVFVLEG